MDRSRVAVRVVPLGTITIGNIRFVYTYGLRLPNVEMPRFFGKPGPRCWYTRWWLTTRAVIKWADKNGFDVVVEK